MSTRHIDIDPVSGHVRITFEYNPELVTLIKNLPQRRWSGQVRAWYTPLPLLPRLWDALKDHSFTASNELRQVALERFQLTLPSPPDPISTPRAPDGAARLTPSQINATVRDRLHIAFPNHCWVIAQLSGWKPSRGRTVYFDLREPSQEGAGTIARVSAIILPKARERMDQALSRIGGLHALQDGMEVCMKARVDLYPANGRYQLLIEDIDPHHTLGHIHDQRKIILSQLESLGILEHNRSRPLPLVPLRIGLITSLGSHAYNDFINELRTANFAFHIHAYDAHMQGHYLQETVSAALRYFAEHPHLVDALVIIRGGGARTDLAWFDTLPLARAVCEHPVPILVGIGHHQDRSVLDEVARSFKTPTAVGNFLADQTRDFLTALDTLTHHLKLTTETQLHNAHTDVHDTATTLSTRATHLLQQHRTTLRTHAHSVHSTTRTHLRHSNTTLHNLQRRIPEAAQRFIKRTHKHQDTLHERLSIPRLQHHLKRTQQSLDQTAHTLQRETTRTLHNARSLLSLLHARTASAHPQRILQRGFAIVRDEHQRVVHNASNTTSQQPLHITLAQGTLRAHVSSDPNTTKDPNDHD